VLVLHGGIGDGSWGLDELRHKVGLLATPGRDSLPRL
jgi:hypothetical protein